MQKLLGKIGKVLFHRLGIVGVLIIAQIVLYVAGLVVLRDSAYFDRVEWLFLALSVLAALWIVGSKANPGYKIGWLIIVLGLMPFGSLAYLLLGGNHLSAFNQRRLRSMDRKIRRNLGDECRRSASLGELILHGRYVCKARKPMCESCFLTDICRYYATESANADAMPERKVGGNRKKR